MLRWSDVATCMGLDRDEVGAQVGPAFAEAGAWAGQGCPSTSTSTAWFTARLALGLDQPERLFLPLLGPVGRVHGSSLPTYLQRKPTHN